MKAINTISNLTSRSVAVAAVLSSLSSCEKKREQSIGDDTRSISSPSLEKQSKIDSQILRGDLEAIKSKCTVGDFLIQLKVVEDFRQRSGEELQAARMDALNSLKFVESDGPTYVYKLNGGGGVLFAVYALETENREVFHPDLLQRSVIGFEYSVNDELFEYLLIEAGQYERTSDR